MSDDDYDYESILETIAPLYIAEGKDSTRQFLVENKFSEELADALLKILDELSQKPRDDA